MATVTTAGPEPSATTHPHRPTRTGGRADPATVWGLATNGPSASSAPSTSPGSSRSPHSSAPSSGGAGLGTFGGVFTPSILTILGLVLFLRVPFVVGSVGLVRSLVILALATSVSILTSISLATVATNMRVGGGGEYFIISRTLGIEFGGAVGLVLYLAISVSIGFYAIGFAEAVAGGFGNENPRLIQLIAAATILVLLAIGLIGADLATRLQYIVLTLLVISLISFFTGVLDDLSASRMADNLGASSQGLGFWAAFAIFFPAVTGFSQGVAMSGDLRSPSRSITRGTFAAVGLSTVVYAAAIVFLAGAASAATLVDETTTVMGELSLAAPTILVGVLAATVSSALASTLGGPRVLQRLGEDRVLPRLELFAHGAGPSNNPRRATTLSAGIALATVALGDLNAVAPVISMFFLASYGMINYATYYEIQAGSTSFRPRFRWYDRRASLAGTLACGGAILAINPLAGAVAGMVLVGLYSYLRRRDVPDRWSDSAGAFHYTQARKHLQRLGSEPFGSRDWRPCSLVFVPRDPVARTRMITVASWVEGDLGYTTAVRLLEGSDPRLRQQAGEIEADLDNEVADSNPGVYARVVATADLRVGVNALVQSHGIGEVRANMAVFGVRDLRGSEEDQRSYGQLLQGCARLGTNVAIVSVDDHAWDRFEATAPDDRTIALWWSDDQVGKLITLLAWLCRRDPEWAHARVVAHVPATSDPGESDRVASLLAEARITADVVQVERSAAAFADAMAGATLALAPLRIKRGRALGPFDSPVGMLVESLPLAILVLATQELDLNTQPDDVLAELARKRERVTGSRQRVAELDAEAARLLVAAEQARLELESARDGGTGREQPVPSRQRADGARPEGPAGRAGADGPDGPDGADGSTGGDGADDPADHVDLAALAAVAEQAQVEARTAFRRYVDAKTRLDTMIDELDELDPHHSASEMDPAIWRSASRHDAPA